MQAHNLISTRTVRFQAQTMTLSLPSDAGCLYEVGVDLYYNDGAGNPVRITQSGAVAGTPGSIANLLPPASASFVAASATFVLQSAVNTPGNLDGGFIILRNNTANSFGLTLEPPPAMGSDYTIVLPSLPASDAPLIIDSSGNITARTALFPAFSPTGSVTMYAAASAPPGWLICDGSAVSRTVYAALFSVIGVLWGPGDGSTTFNIPDMSGRVPGGTGGTLGGLTTQGGVDSISLSSANLPQHTHSGTTGTESVLHSHTIATTNFAGNGGNQKVASSSGNTGDLTPGVTSAQNVLHTHNFTTDGGPGSRDPFSLLQPYTVINFIIKT
jgi:microcystin-dependent protein